MPTIGDSAMRGTSAKTWALGRVWRARWREAPKASSVTGTRDSAKRRLQRRGRELQAPVVGRGGVRPSDRANERGPAQGEATGRRACIPGHARGCLKERSTAPGASATGSFSPRRAPHRFLGVCEAKMDRRLLPRAPGRWRSDRWTTARSAECRASAFCWHGIGRVRWRHVGTQSAQSAQAKAM